MMFSEYGPSAGPTGGAGVALPACNCKPILPTTFLAIESSFSSAAKRQSPPVERAPGRGGACGATGGVYHGVPRPATPLGGHRPGGRRAAARQSDPPSKDLPARFDQARTVAGGIGAYFERRAADVFVRGTNGRRERAGSIG